MNDIEEWYESNIEMWSAIIAMRQEELTHLLQREVPTPASFTMTALAELSNAKSHKVMFDATVSDIWHMMGIPMEEDEDAEDLHGAER